MAEVRQLYICMEVTYLACCMSHGIECDVDKVNCLCGAARML